MKNNTCTKSACELIELVHDRNDKKRPPIGVVLATVASFKECEGPVVTFGWSRVHSKLDVFDKEKGIQIARNRALNPLTRNGTRNGVIPNYVDVKLTALQERAKRYFKEIPFLYS